MRAQKGRLRLAKGQKWKREDNLVGEEREETGDSDAEGMMEKEKFGV